MYQISLKSKKPVEKFTVLLIGGGNRNVCLERATKPYVTSREKIGCVAIIRRIIYEPRATDETGTEEHVDDGVGNTVEMS